MRRKAAFLFFFALIVFGIVRLYFGLTDDIRLSNMQHEMPYRHEWEPPNLDKEKRELLERLFSEEFTYLGKGSQSYVFVSPDGRYVVKFFKFKHLRPASWHRFLPPLFGIKQWREREELRKERKLWGVFEGYRIAYDCHREEAGLVFIHLQPTDTIKQKLYVRDKLGLRRQLDLDRFVFVVQKRGSTTRQKLAEALDRNDLKVAEKLLDSLFLLYFSEYRKGIYDHDHGILDNTGFVNGKAVRLDLGKVRRSRAVREAAAARADMELVIERLIPWLAEEYPAYSPHFVAYIEGRLGALYPTEP